MSVHLSRIADFESKHGIIIDEGYSGHYSNLGAPLGGIAYFRRDEFTFSIFEVENRVRFTVRAYTEWFSSPAAGLGTLLGPRFAGKERVSLSLTSPVFGSLKTLGISERLSRKPPYAREIECVRPGRTDLAPV